MARKTRVLVVDDFATMRRVASAVLRELGFVSIDEAQDGEEALSKLRSGDYGLVLSDWNMPRMDGLTLLKSIRSDERLARLPVLMLTAEGMKQNVIDAVRAGASGYVVKPFAPATLQERVENLGLE